MANPIVTQDLAISSTSFAGIYVYDGATAQSITVTHGNFIATRVGN